MNDIPEELMSTEDAVETADGLVSILSYVHETAPDGDRARLRSPIGYTLNALSHELQRARAGYGRLYRRHWARKERS